MNESWHSSDDLNSDGFRSCLTHLPRGPMLIRICTQATDSVTWLDRAWDLGDWILSWEAADLDRCQDLALETCFEVKHHTPRLSRTHGWQQFRASYLLLQELFGASATMSSDRSPKEKKRRRSPKNVHVHGQGAVLSTAVTWANSITGLDSPLYLLTYSPQGSGNWN